jgi:hypothetical protein
MTDDRGRLGRFGDALRSGSRAAREGIEKAQDGLGKLRDMRQEIRDRSDSDAHDRPPVEALLPGQRVLYIGMGSVGADRFRLEDDAGRKMADVAESFDPKAFLIVLGVFNPAVWLDAILTPVRMAAQFVVLPVEVAALAAGRAASPGTGDPGSVAGLVEGLFQEKRPVIPLSPEQEAFRRLFSLSPYEPLEDQLAEIAYNERYVFSRNLDSIAGSFVLFNRRYATLDQFSRPRLVVTDSHVHLVNLDYAPAEGPETREPAVMWSVDRHQITEWETRPFKLNSVHRVSFADGSWVRFRENVSRQAFRQRLHEAVGSTLPAGAYPERSQP